MFLFNWNCTGLWHSSESTARHIFLEIPREDVSLEPLSEILCERLKALLLASDESVIQALLLMEGLGNLDFSSIFPCIYQTQYSRLYHLSYSRGERSFDEGIFVLKSVIVEEKNNKEDTLISLDLMFPVTEWDVSFALQMHEPNQISITRTNKMGTSESKWVRYGECIEDKN